MFEEFEKIKNVPLCNFSTMKTGGKAKWILFPKNHFEVQKILQICEENKLKSFILGNGSNVLFADEGFGGAVISLRHFDKISICEEIEERFCDEVPSAKICDREFEEYDKKPQVSDFVKANEGTEKCFFVRVGAGVNLFALNLKLQKMGIGGLEWCYGIPATLGGFVVSNGGCFGHEIGELVEEVIVLDEGNLKRLKKGDLFFSYRNSNLKGKIVLSAKLSLKREKSEKIMQNMQFFLQKKRENQPCDMSSLGSVFKRSVDEKSGETLFPAKLIDNMGLKGVKIGGAEVSKKHAGFIVNAGGATSSDVLALIEFLEKKLAEVGVHVEREIEIQ